MRRWAVLLVLVILACGRADAEYFKVTASDIITKGPWVDVRAFIPATLHASIAAGTDNTDLIVYLQTAIDNCTGSSTVFLPPGTYNFRSSLRVGSATVNRIEIRGSGPNTILVFTPSAADNAIENLTGGTDHIKISNLTLRQANGTSVSGVSGVVVDSGGTAWMFDRVHFQGFSSHGIDVDSAQYLRINNCRFLQIENSGVHDGLASGVNITTFSNATTITNSIFTQNDRHLTIGSSGGSLYIAGNTFELAGSTGNTFGFTDSIYIDNVDSTVFVGNYLEGNITGTGYAALHLNSVGSPVVEGNYFVGAVGGVTKTDIMAWYENCDNATNEKNFYAEVLSAFIKTTGFVVKTRANTYYDGGNGLTTYDAIVALFSPATLIGTDVPKTITWSLNVVSKAFENLVDVGVTGVTLKDTVQIVPPYDLEGMMIQAAPQADNNIRIVVYNPTNDNIVKAADNGWKVYVDKKY